MSATSSPPTPFRDGFAALLHEPMLLPSELAWRWCFGSSALGLGILSIAVFLDSLKLTRADEFLIRTWQPQLLDSALRHIFRGSLSRFLLEQAILLLGVILLWSLAATAGRAATLHRLVSMFSVDEEARPMEWRFVPIFILQVLRAMWSVIACVVALGSLLYGMVMLQNDHPLRAALALSFGVGLACFFGIVLNWYFGLAPLFCIRNRGEAMEALEQAEEFSTRHTGRLWLLGLGFLTLRAIWAATMFFAVLSPLSLAADIGPRWVMCLMGIMGLVYFAGADLLYLARLGAYAALAEDDARPVSEVIVPEIIQPADMVPLVGLA